MLVVRAYNNILSDLAPDERRLFNDHIRRLDKRINQGLTKLTWASKNRRVLREGLLRALRRKRWTRS